jgi:hypothetical protein
MTTIKTVEVVTLSEIFRECDELLGQFTYSVDFTWGDADLTLISRDIIFNEVDELKYKIGFSSELLDQVNIVLGRLDLLHGGIFIDLEN